MARTRVRWRRVGTLCLASALAAGTLAARAGAGPADQGGRRPMYVVHSGDTVWRIAEGLVGEGDPRPVVDRIISENGLRNARILPGQRLVLPVLGR